MSAAVKVTVVHDVNGRIVSVNRPVEGAKVIVLTPDGHSSFETEVDPDSIVGLGHTHYADHRKKALIPMDR
jgi:hypothetical protein